MNAWPTLGRMVVVLALSFSLGPHWALLQTLAWAGMLISYSHDCSFTEAVAKTFDGEHPCKLCKIVSEGKKTEKTQKVLKPQGKLDYWSSKPASFIHPARPIPRARSFVAALHPRSEPPPFPPPRLLAVTL